METNTKTDRRLDTAGSDLLLDVVKRLPDYAAQHPQKTSIFANYHLHKNPQVILILSQINPVYNLSSIHYSLKKK